MQHNNTIILMTRFPKQGQVKTRLIPSHGVTGATLLHSAMAKFSFCTCLNLDCNINVQYIAENQAQMQEWLYQINNSLLWINKNKYKPLQADSIKFLPQQGDDLGEKMHAAIAQAFHNFYEHTTPPANKPNQTHQTTRKKVILIGSDCPNNRLENLQKSFDLLNENSCVLGPSLDGGYYLIGFAYEEQCAINNGKKSFDKQALQAFLCTIKPIFQDIVWSTSSVFEETKTKIIAQNLSLGIAEILNDIDIGMDVPAKISVIIPTLNDETALNKLLCTLPPAFNVEILIADASKTEKIKNIALEHELKYIPSEAGRAKQINTAAQLATGEILFFLHADSLVPAQWDMEIRKALNEKQVSIGYFRFGIMEDFYTKAIIEWGTNLRCKYFNLPYGDQGLFVRKADFISWGLQDTPILEDVFLVKAAQKHGRVLGLPVILYTSGRRWLKHGLIRTTIINTCVMFCAKIGMNLHDIKQAYVLGQNPIYYAIRKLFSKN